MLAIADHVNPDKDNVAWPGVTSLAALTRKSARHVQRELRALERSGELQIIANQGPHGTNLYKICLPLNVTADIRGALDTPELVTVTSSANSGDASDTQSVKETLLESTPIVPKGDIGFWIEKCFECFTNLLMRYLPVFSKPWNGRSRF